MAFEPKNLMGALFKHDKEGNEARPDYKGDCMINGVEYQIGAWLKVSAKGNKFMSLKFEAKKRPESTQDGPDTQTRGQGSSAPTTQRVGSVRPSATDARVNQRMDDDDFSDSVPF